MAYHSGMQVMHRKHFLTLVCPFMMVKGVQGPWPEKGWLTRARPTRQPHRPAEETATGEES